MDRERQSAVSATNIALLLFSVLVLCGLYLTSRYNYLLFHSLAEIFSIVVACGIFIVFWNSRRFLENGYYLFVGIAYLFIGGLDLIHTLGYTGMSVFPGYDTNLPAQLWIASRYLESLSLLAAPFFLRRRLKPGLVFIGYTVVSFLLLGSIFYWNVFPDCFVEGVGLTPFKKISEYIISLILVASIVRLYQRREKFDAGVFQLLIASIIVTIGAELSFTLYVHAYGLPNMIGHLLKVVSFYLVYKAFIEAGLAKPYALIFRDLKQSEEALRESEARLKSIFRAAPTGIGLVSNRVILQVNERMCEMVGYTNDELIGKSARVLYPTDEDFECVGREKYTQIQERGTGTMETRLKRKDGQIIDVLLSSTPLDPADLSSGVTFTALDITERKQAEEALLESEQRYRQLFESIGDAVMVYSLRGRFLDCNEAALQRLGYSHEELLRLGAADIVHPDFHLVMKDNQEKIWAGEDTVVESAHRCKDGKIIPVEVNARRIEYQGKPAILAVVRDITERKRAEETLRESEERYRELADSIAASPSRCVSVFWLGPSPCARGSRLR